MEGPVVQNHQHGLSYLLKSESGHCCQGSRGKTLNLPEREGQKSTFSQICSYLHGEEYFEKCSSSV